MTGAAPPDPDALPTGRRPVPMALLTWAFMAAVLLIVVVLVVLRVTQGTTTAPTPSLYRAPDTVVRAVTSIPPNVFDAAGAPASGTTPQALSGQSVLQSGGRAEVVFVGAQFSPYSAAARWALVAALARFGTFDDLGATSSSAAEVFPRTPTFSFTGSAYRSAYVTLVSEETYGSTLSSDAPAGFPALTTPTGAVAGLLRRFDGASTGAGPVTLPFVDVGNQVVFLGADIGFSPGLLRHQSMAQVASAMSDPANPLGRAIISAANELAAAVCASTSQHPEAVCSSAGVRAGAARVGLH